MFFNLSIPVFHMNESVSRLNSDGEEGRDSIQVENGVCCMAVVSILWLRFSHSFSINTSVTVQ